MGLEKKLAVDAFLTIIVLCLLLQPSQYVRTLGRGRPYKLSDCIGKVHIISVISQAGDPVSREIRGLFFGFLYPPVARFN